ncbi:MAG: TAXI family TRAP transporter solute-binding subunit [Armatimonadota bacterium]|nr:TAXI family TRAP transporter solute-binding subunit [Armatimonadota bacterium]MDR7452238.1 TAXI family TRAP transporter solute-binding subunit [Armatimonadota bacterium]MDR7466667.1 TAXI family TRAP transporter solute-binding subunit [Armatimonadota bacterium]MDR7492859.1 TAXI family TRAP transporter solute-binding subunit [Armatimonadota bacterium]MDR7498635.1 TAXI family TRAP transporter solute-binding subunit [Armatimonadota bacterium]
MGRLWRRYAAAVVVLAAVLAVSLPQTLSAAPKVRMTILGGPPAGVFGIFATGIATYINRAVPEVDLSVAATGGSTENVRRLQAKGAEMGLAFASDVYEAYNGLEIFQGTRHTNLRALGLVFNGASHIVTYQDSGIRSVAELAGKRVAVGTPGSGTFATAERVFRVLGIWDRITRVPLLGAAAASALQDGRVDAFFFTGPYPDRGTIEAAMVKPIRMLDAYTPAAAAGFLRQFPYYSRFDFPAGGYPGMTESVPAVGIPLLWLAHVDVPAPIIQTILAAAYSVQGHEHMLRVHAAAADMRPRQALKGIAIPLHRGAEAYWRSVGLEIPEAIRAR